MKKLIFAMAMAVAAYGSPALAGVYDLDPDHSSVGFSVKHMVVSNVKGGFDKVTGTFTLGEKGELTDAEATIDVASVNTRNQKRDDHLRSPDFFDVAKFPSITFKITKIKAHQIHYMVTGDLTIKGVTKPVMLMGELVGTVKDPWGNTRAGFTASGKINRKDFGVNFHKVLEAGGLVVGDEVNLLLEIEGIERKK
ncbi:MAG: YceI family protein [Nitrospinota bacterium]|nr:YceI family protein [Nitrospinota bacterium]MDH5678112.1 YceI family protein [Nitrospinota bacterium]MDH5755688.1 YceI family protein [Nitrospinota bacterium]